DNSVLGVVHGDYEAAAVANTVMRQMANRGAFDPADVRSIYKSGTFPTTGYGHIHTLEPRLAARVKEAFFSFPWEGTALQQEFSELESFLPIEYRTDWDVVRKVDAAAGVRYDCK